MNGIVIIGVGVHPFGRHEGVSALEMGAHAVRAALADAGIQWADVQFAYGGSEDGGNADTMVTELGPIGLPFTNVRNGCATGGSALVSAVRTLESGAYDVGLVVGFDKHPRGAFQNDPADWSLPDWYGEDGLMVTTQFFGAKLQRYMHDFDISRETLRGSPRRRSRTARSRPMRGAGSRCRPLRSAPRRCSRTRSRSTCCAHRERERRH